MTFWLIAQPAKRYRSQRLPVIAYYRGTPNNALNCRSLRSLDSQKLRFCLPVSLIVSWPVAHRRRIFF